MADKKYVGNNQIITEYDISVEDLNRFKSFRVHIEHINAMIKNFKILSETFRGTYEQHQKVFFLICHIINIVNKE